MSNFSVGGVDASLMSEDNHTNGTAADLDAGTFDLASFISDTATYATYTVTVHLAAEEARRSIELAEKLDALQSELDAATEANKLDSSTNTSLGEVPAGVAKARRLSEQIAELNTEREPLVAKVKSSALTFAFACTGRDMQKSLADRVSGLLSEATAEAGIDPDSAQSTAEDLGRDPKNLIRQTGLLMQEMTSKVTNANGQVYPKDKLTEEVLQQLLNTLPINEIGRINNALALAITGAQDYDRAVDAGFPR